MKAAIPITILLACFAPAVTAFAPHDLKIVRTCTSTSLPNEPNPNNDHHDESRRQVFQNAIMGFTAATTAAAVAAFPAPSLAAVSGAADQSNQYAPEFVQAYDDFTRTDTGMQFKDVKLGKGDVILEPGDRAVFDWSGYTIGYFGRPFEAKGGPTGGAFDKDIDYFRTVIGSKTVVPGLELGIMDMKPGGVRQIIVPYGSLSYPANDLEHTKVGPKPTTFSGQRALNFVLENPRVDRTLLFNVKLVRIDKANGSGGFIRG